MGVIYQARNKISGKRYIGKTMYTMKARRAVHECHAKTESRLPFHRALRKYGFDTFEWKVISREEIEDYLNEAEQVFIRILKSKVPSGYNLTDGGEGNIGWVPSEEWKRKKSEEQKGKTTPIEVRLKISRALRGKHPSEVTRAKLRLRKNRKGKVHSEEAKKKMSASRMGKGTGPKSKETREKMSKAAKKRIQTVEGKKQIQRFHLAGVKAQIGRVHSESEIESQKISLRKTWNDPDRRAAWLEARRIKRQQAVTV